MAIFNSYVSLPEGIQMVHSAIRSVTFDSKNVSLMAKDHWLVLDILLFHENIPLLVGILYQLLLSLYSGIYIYIYCLVLWNMAFIFHNTSIWVVILPIDELICFKVVKTTKQ